MRSSGNIERDIYNAVLYTSKNTSPSIRIRITKTIWTKIKTPSNSIDNGDEVPLALGDRIDRCVSGHETDGVVDVSVDTRLVILAHPLLVFMG